MMKKQQGASFWSVTGTVVIVGSVILLVAKLFPAYAEFYAVKKALARIETGGSLATMTEQDILKTFDRSSVMDDIRNVTPKDLKIQRAADGTTTIVADYQVIVPIVGNVSALMKFHAQTGTEKPSKY
ncbi:MAG: DUF4845 domain-containing protein [Methylobacillus sp.]|jgi:hypothetical protein|nr:DUF4845 domain-containing protein [Methylobacillus sp.]